MAAAATVTKLKPKTDTAPAIIPTKSGWFGPQGSGKTTSAALFALGLSVQYHDKAPVFVTDTEPGWQFLRRLFQTEGVELIQRTTPTFAAMMDNIREAEKLGSCVYVVDSLSIIWQELMQSFKKKNRGFIPINVWGDIKQMWGEYATAFLNSPMHCMALGRLGNVMEEIDVEDGKGNATGQTKLIKTATQFKAGGGESFGYEPHLLLELSVERKNKVVKGSKREGEGRVTHRVDVLKDRSWALNGKVIRWSDKASYAKGGYNTVWESLKPHFTMLQETGSAVAITEGKDSTSLIADSGASLFYENKARRDVIVAEVSATLDLLWTGTGKEEKRMRIQAIESVFGFKTKDALERESLSKVERGCRILQLFEARCKANPDILQADEAAVLEILGKVVVEYDESNKEDDDDLPF